MNAINVITPHMENGIWMFDDSSRGLHNEPFVGNMNNIINKMIDDSAYINPYEEVSIFFAKTDFPGAEFVLTADGEDCNGMWYRWGNKEDAMKGWLCPATLKFFDYFPEKIYIKLYTNTKI